MTFFRGSPLRKEYLIPDASGHRYIEAMKGRSLSDRLDYAWKIYHSKQPIYKNIHKKGALAFISKVLGIPKDLDPDIANQSICLLMELKNSKPGLLPYYSESLILNVTPKPKTILIAVSDGYNGYGDFLFAL